MGLTGQIGSVPKGGIAVSFRNGWVKHLKVALSSAGGVAVVLALFDLLQHEPTAGFGLLLSWGPWPFIALVALAILGKFLSRMNDTIQVTFGAVVTSAQQGAEAQAKGAEANARTADALSRLADQGGRHALEVERLTTYAVQEFPLVHERLDRQDEMLRQIHGLVSKRENHNEKD